MNALEMAQFLRSMTPNELAGATAGWGIVIDWINDRAQAKSPKPKVFEVHHETEVAREEFLTALKNGDPVDAAVLKAANRIGISTEGLSA